jgi:4-amino-4-deoxy-L-arabinose transferase-like glycosyltransferase
LSNQGIQIDGDPKWKRVLRLHRHKIFLFLVIVTGIGLRIWHINWSLPEIYEEAYPFFISGGFWNWGQIGLNLNPHFFHYPALTFYLNFLVQVIHYLIGHVMGLFPDLQTFKQVSETAPTSFVISARLISVIFDIGTISIIYILGKECAGKTAALIAAAFTATNPLLIEQSHLINVDTPLTFFSMLSLLFIYRMYNNTVGKWYLFAGIGIGLAAASKYNGALLILVLVAAHLLRSDSINHAIRSLKSIHLLIAIIASLVVFIFCNPYIFTSFDEFNRDFSFEESHMSTGHLGIDPTLSTFEFYVLNSIPSRLGWGLLIIVAISIVYFIYQRKKARLLLLIFPFLYLAVIISWQMRADRYLLPVVPPLLLIGSIGLREIAETTIGSIKTSQLIKMVSFNACRVTIGIVLAFVLFFEPVSALLRYHQSLEFPDTRMIAKEWIKTYLPRGSVIAEIPMGIDFPDKSYKIFLIPFLTVNSEQVIPFYDTRWYEDFDLVVGSDYDYGRYSREPNKYGEFMRYYNSLRTQWKLELEVKPKKNQTGPTIWFYRFPDSLTSSLFDTDLLQRFKVVPVSKGAGEFLKELSSILVAKGKIGKAEQIARIIVASEPNDPDAHKLWAALLYSLKQYEKALAEATLCLHLKPNQVDVLSIQGNILIRLNRLDEAEINLKMAIELNPTFEIAYRDLLTIYRKRDDKQNAIDLLARYKKAFTLTKEKEKFIEDYLRALQGTQ